MHSCGSAQGNMVGPCSCGQSNSAFSMLFSATVPNQSPFEFDEAAAAAASAYEYPFASPSYAPSSVDCTLSLGTPSTRLTDVDSGGDARGPERRRSGPSCIPTFCWDILQTGTGNHAPPQGRRGGGGGNHNEPLFARRCANCDTTSTPLWRNGPRGPKSLCNACGIRFKKEERRAAATANSGAGMAEQQQMMMSQHNGNSWGPSKAMANEFSFMGDEDRDPDHNSIPFLSWRLNVADRASLVNDFTRY